MGAKMAFPSGGGAPLDLQELTVHLLDLPSGHMGPVSTKAPSEGMGDMQQFVNEHLYPIFFAERIKSFRDDLDNVLGLLVEG